MKKEHVDVIIMDKESRKKCSIYPLSYREDMNFIHSSIVENFDENHFKDFIFLHVDGEPLSEKDKDYPILLVDASWKRAMKIAKYPALQNLRMRSLSGISTSYPRVSKIYPMPHGGLASIEAFYLTRLIQGRASMDLLAHYHWKEKFLEDNKEYIEKWERFWREKK